jgi:superfamily II DNA or RNA helicase
VIKTIQLDWDVTKGVSTLKCPPELFSHIREEFSIPNENYRFQRRFARYTPKRLYAITPTGRFSPGLFYDIKRFVNETYKNIEFKYSDVFLKNIKPSFEINDLASLKLDLRDYQKDIVRQSLKIGRGVAVLATAGGKTLTMACLIETIYKKLPDNGSVTDFKCLVIVPTLNLVHQTASDFEDYNVSFTSCKWTGNEPLDPSANVVVANVGILQSSKTDTEWLKYIDILIVDEVHMLRKGNKINKLIKNIITPNKFGLTGTLPESKLDQWNIFGLIGPKLYEKNSKALRDEDYIGKVITKIVEIGYLDKPERCDNPNDRYRKEIEFITRNEFRNNIIGKLTSNIKNNCLIMVDYIEHGQLLYESVIKHTPDKQVYYIKGDVDITERERVRELMEKHNDVTIIAISKIFSTGINIKNLHYIVFAGGGKAKIKIIQSIGRGLRLHKGRKELIIIDITDLLTYGIKHGNQRKILYDEEEIRYKTSSIKEKTKKS